MKLNEDFRYQFKSGCEFSGRDSGFLVVESLELPKKGVRSRFQLSLHVDFVCTVLELNHQRCFWLAENPSVAALEDLKRAFPDHHILNGSVLGYFDFDRQLIARFWTAFESANQTQPWANEQAWALGGSSGDIPLPEADSLLHRPHWSVEHILKNHDKMNAVFVQAGYFGFFAVRVSDKARLLIEKEFAQLR